MEAEAASTEVIEVASGGDGGRSSNIRADRCRREGMEAEAAATELIAAAGGGDGGRRSSNKGDRGCTRWPRR